MNGKKMESKDGEELEMKVEVFKGSGQRVGGNVS
jgi:hypothetical protein